MATSCSRTRSAARSAATRAGARSARWSCAASTPAQRDPLLGVWGDAEPAHVTHLESVLALPAGAVRLAESDLDPVQAFSVGERAWGVQFHPEFDAETVRAYSPPAARRCALRGSTPTRCSRTSARRRAARASCGASRS